MKVKDVMTTDVVTVEPRMPFRDVVQLLVEREISSVPVVDRSGALVGLVSEADLLPKEAFPEGRSRRALTLLADMLGGVEVRWVSRADGLTAGDVMSLEPVTVEPTDDVHAVARMLLAGGISQFPVVDHGQLVGVVARRDVLRTFLRTDGEIAADVAAELRALRHALDHEVDACVAQGAVVLEGAVRHPEDAAVLVRVVERVPGVVHVQDLLTVRDAEA
jgi:CBS domain-containing protein